MGFRLWLWRDAILNFLLLGFGCGPGIDIEGFADYLPGPGALNPYRALAGVESAPLVLVRAGREMPSIELEPTLGFACHYGNLST